MMKDKLKNLKKSYKHTFCILLAAVALSAMAAFGVYAYELPAREYSCNRRIYINLDDGASELMFWMARVDRDCSNYNEGKWLDGVAANEKLKPKYGDERITERYYDNEMPTDSPNGFYEHVDCVGATPYIWIVEPEKENCKFKGWETNTSYEKITYEGYDYWIFSAGAYATDVVSGSSGRCEDITIKAVWEPEVYVDYNMNGGYLTSDSSYVASDSGWMRPADGTPYTQVVYPDDWGSPAYDKDFGLKRDGYVFKGWTTVSYSDNVNDLNYRPGVGYYYGDWAADAYYNDYFGTYYVDLYAVWEPIIHVDYNMNGGYLESNSSYVNIDGWMRPADGTSYVQSVNPDDWGVVYSDAEFKLKRDGYILKGWTTVKGSNSTADINYRPGVGYYYNDWESDAYYNDYFGTYYVDLYAVWEEGDDKTYNVKFNPNGGSGVMQEQTYICDIPGKLPWNEFTRAGYEFMGWSTDKDANTPDYADGAQIINLGAPYSTVELYAIWKYGKYTIRFNGNGASEGLMADIRPRYDESVTLPENVYQRNGYVFDGWNTKSDGSGASYTDKQTVIGLVNPGEVITLYAQWRANEAAVIYNAAGGNIVEENYQVLGDGRIADTKGSLLKDKVSYNGSITLRRAGDLGLERYGYIFAGWKTKDGEALLGDGVASSWEQLTDRLAYEDGGTVELFAVWEKCEFTYLISHNGGVEQVHGGGTYLYGDRITISADIKKGYIFEYMEDLDTGEKWTTNPTEFIVEGNRRLYVSARPIKYTIEFEPEGGINPPPDIETEYGKEEVPGGVPERPGFNFEGWNTEEDGSGTSYGPDDVLQNLTTQDGDKVPLYAQWRQKRVRIVKSWSSVHGHTIWTRDQELVARFQNEPWWNETYQEWNKLSQEEQYAKCIMVYTIKNGVIERIK